MKPYPTYKESGIAWLGEIPEHWESKQLKFFADIVLGKMLTSTDKGGYFQKPYLRAKNILWENVDVSDVKEMWFSEKELALYRLQCNDLLVSEGGEVGRTAIWQNEVDECYIQNSVNRVRVSPENIPQYFLYQFVAFGKRGHFNAIVDRVSIAHLTKEKLKDVAMFVPPTEEQQAIADYLDRKTAALDSLIAKKERQIALLQEQRTAVINHAVTKGLNPHAPLKDSGIEWIGQTPSHWEIKRVGYVSNVVRGSTPRPAGSPQYFDGNACPWITVGEITKDDGKYLYETSSFLTEEGVKFSRFLEKGTLVLTNSGATLGVPKILKIAGCINDGSVALLDIKSFMSQDFLYYFFKDLTKKYRDLMALSSGQPNLNTDIVRSTYLPVPPLFEQIEIVEYLNEKIEKTDIALEKINQTIQMLQEYRTAVISAAVTGKIDVREAVPSP